MGLTLRTLNFSWKKRFPPSPLLQVQAGHHLIHMAANGQSLIAGPFRILKLGWRTTIYHWQSFGLEENHQNGMGIYQMTDVTMCPRRWNLMQWSVICIQNRRCRQPICDACLANDTLFLSNEEVRATMSTFLLREKIEKSILTDEFSFF